MKKLSVSLLFLSSAVSIAFGQESGKITFFATPDACVTAPLEKVNEYQPVFSDGLLAWEKLRRAELVQLVQNHGKRYCAEEWSMEAGIAGWHIIMWPLNNPYFKNPTNGQIADARCGNKVRRIWEVPPPSPPPPPPLVVEAPPPPGPGQVCFEKETHEPPEPGKKPRSIPMPTGVFRFFAGMYSGDPDASGKVCVSVPPGIYPVREGFVNPLRDAKFWKQDYISASVVTVGSGETQNVTVINSKVFFAPPEPAKPIHVCPDCGEVTGSQPLTSVVWTPNLQLFLRVNWPGVKVSGVFWKNYKVADFTSAAEGLPFALLTAQSFAGPGLYDEVEVHGVDDQGHLRVCAFDITIVAPPPAKVTPPKKGGHKKAKIIVGVVIGACVAEVIATYFTRIPLPPCGWIKMKLLSKPNSPVYTKPANGLLGAH